MNVNFHSDVYKQLQKLPRPVFAAVLDKIIGLSSEPRPTGAIKLAGSVNDWRIRIGQYRIVYEVNDRDHVVTVLTVARRSDAYR